MAYHAIADVQPGADPHDLCTHPAVFAEHLRLLSERRQVVSLGDAVAGRFTSGRPAVAITFDDGYRSVLSDAAPLLERHGFPATVFVPTAHLGGHNTWDGLSGDAFELLDAQELVTLQSAGVDVQSHGHAHIDMSTASATELRSDLQSSIESLEAIRGSRPSYLAFPYGRTSPSARRAVADAGFAAAFTIEVPHDGRYAVGRVALQSRDPRWILLLKTSGRFLGLRHSPGGRALSAARGLLR